MVQPALTKLPSPQLLLAVLSAVPVVADVFGDSSALIDRVSDDADADIPPPAELEPLVPEPLPVCVPPTAVQLPSTSVSEAAYDAVASDEPLPAEDDHAVELPLAVEVLEDVTPSASELAVEELANEEALVAPALSSYHE